MRVTSGDTVTLEMSGDEASVLLAAVRVDIWARQHPEAGYVCAMAREDHLDAMQNLRAALSEAGIIPDSSGSRGKR